MQEPLDKLVDEGGASRCGSQSGRAPICYGEQVKEAGWKHPETIAEAYREEGTIRLWRIRAQY